MIRNPKECAINVLRFLSYVLSTCLPSIRHARDPKESKTPRKGKAHFLREMRSQSLWLQATGHMVSGFEFRV